MPERRDWDKDLAKIERQIGSMSDAELLEASARQRLKEAGSAPAVMAAGLPAAPAGAKVPGKWNVYARLVLSVGLAVGIMFWPYGTRCGWGLAGYLCAAAMISVTGLWASIGTWKTRMPAGHVIALLLMLWGLVLGAREVLPRAGYALPTEARPAIWLCS